MTPSRLLPPVLVAIFLATFLPHALAQVSITVQTAPPPLVVYEQPACPEDGYLWVPGYWAYGDDDYYWVPGTWVQPPEPDLYWTPGYWAYNGNAYAFNDGYWGPSVGYYGGIDYGYGYGGDGYRGGRWEGGHFAYNSYVNNVRSANIRNRYEDRTAARSPSVRTSFNGGRGGVQARPSQQNANERRIPATAMQQSHVQAASQDRSQFAKVNGGKPKSAVVAARPEAHASEATHAATAPSPTEREHVKAPAAQSQFAPEPRAQAPEEKHSSSVMQDRAVTPSHEAQAPASRTEVAPTRHDDVAKPQSHAQEAPQAQPHAHAETHPQTHGAPEAKPQGQPAGGNHPQPAAGGPGQAGGNREQH